MDSEHQPRAGGIPPGSARPAPARQRMIGCALVAHAVFALLAATWLYIDIRIIVAAVCLWPFWWAILGFRGLRTRLLCWSLAVGSVIYLPSAVVLFMVSFMKSGPR